MAAPWMPSTPNGYPSMARCRDLKTLQALLAGKRAAQAAARPAGSAPAGPAPDSPRRLLGIDTALRTTGFGIVDCVGTQMTAVDCGVIRTAPGEPFSECLRRLAGGIRELVRRYAPDEAAIEGAFYCRNVHTTLMLGSARGAVIAVLADMEIPIYEYAPRRVKQSVCGFGNASKAQVALLVAQFLRIQVGNLRNDATDALALAICHAQTARVASGLGLPERL